MGRRDRLLLFPSLVAEPQTVQFRSGTDIIAIDFLAARPDGQPVTDLAAKEVTVKVDGRVREVKSFQFVKLSSAAGDRVGWGRGAGAARAFSLPTMGLRSRTHRHHRRRPRAGPARVRAGTR